MQKLLSFSRALLITVVPSIALGVSAAPPSVCPPVVGERKMMLSVIYTMGSNNQLGRICKVSEKMIQEKSGAQLATLKPCMLERGITDVQVNSEIRSGAAEGQRTYELSGANESSKARESLCARVREQFED